MDLNQYLHREVRRIASTPAEVIAIAAEHGGDHPCDRLVVCGYRDEGQLVAVLPVALDAPVCERVDRIREAVSLLAGMDLTACAIVGYGPPMYGAADRLISGLNAYGITVPLAMYLTGGHCHSYLLDDWPEQGIPYPPAPTTGSSTTDDTCGDRGDRGDAGDAGDTQLQRLVLDAPYGPATANICADPDSLRVTYKIATDTIGLLVTVEPEHGDGHHAIPYGADVHLSCDGTYDTLTVAAVAIAAIRHGGETVAFPPGLLSGAGIDRPLLAAVLRAVIRNWANRPDIHRLQLRSAVRTAAARLPHAQRLLAERQADLADILSDLDDRYHVIRDLRGLAHQHREMRDNPNPHQPPADDRPPPTDPTPIERAVNAAHTVASHVRRIAPGLTVADLHIPAVTAPAVTSVLVDLLYLLEKTGLDPAELMAAASDIYDTEQADQPNT